LPLGKPRLARRWHHCQRAVTTAAAKQPLGVALPSKRRLGALLSSDDFGSRVEREGGGHPLCRVHLSRAGVDAEWCACSMSMGVAEVAVD
jgi:hypothetical protein